MLGRASELNAFVKLGTDKGYIEIELKGFAGKPNLVIRREISAKTKGSSFSLNGQPATGREVSDKMAALNVQVENLWYVVGHLLSRHHLAQLVTVRSCRRTRSPPSPT